MMSWTVVASYPCSIISETRASCSSLRVRCTRRSGGFAVLALRFRTIASSLSRTERIAPRCSEITEPRPGTLTHLSIKNIVFGSEHDVRSEEHTSELQSHHDLVCRLLLAKKKP